MSSRPPLSPVRSHLLLALVLVAASSYLCVAGRYLDRPLRFDETEWPVQAGGILHHGVPKVLYGEEKTLWLSPFRGYDAHYGMWHPPLYQYSLALGTLVLGWSDAALRGVSVLWFAGSLFLAWRLLGLVLPRGTPTVLRALPLCLLLVVPLVAEGSLHLDIDNTSLLFFLLLFAHVFLRDPADESWRRALGLGLLFALTLCSKLTTPFLVLGAAVLFQLLNGRFRGAVRLAAGSALGLSLFLGGYFLYCEVFDYPARFMFEHSYLHNRKIYQPNALWPIVQSLRWHTVWLSPGVTLLLLFAYGARLRAYLVEKRAEPADFLLLSSAAIFFFYVVWGGTFGKYTVPAAVFGILGAAPWLVAALRDARLERTRAYAAACGALLLLHALFLPALQLRPPRAAFASLPWRESILDVRNFLVVFAVCSLVVFHALSRRLLTASRASVPAIVSLLVYIMIANPVNAAKVVLPDYDRSPYRPFFDRGFTQVVSALNAQLGDGTVIISPKDVGYYFRGRHYPLETIGAFHGLSAFRPLIENRRVAAVVDNLKYPTLTDPAQQRLLDRLATRQVHGDYVVWRLDATADRRKG